MKFFRLIVLIAATILLAGGYLTSQLAYAKLLDSRSTEALISYYEKVNAPAISIIALLVLIACVVSVVFQEKKEESSD